jgi:uncharacterized protein (DUF3820 family)
MIKFYENKKMSYGKFKGSAYKDLPEHYLKWLVSNNAAKGKLLMYCNYRLNLPKKNYQVTVTDSIGGDGIYIVQAYTKNDAMHVCIRENKIQSTQSYHGTEFEITEI